MTNGSFLLNFPLLNHEHRKLAVRLVGEVGSGRKVAFLESGADGPRLLEEEPAIEIPSGLEMFGIWPMNLLLLHLAVLGVVFCLARWPIFGRPTSAPPQATSDFGKHIDALGELLELSRDQSYARTRTLAYHQTLRGELSGPAGGAIPTAAIITSTTTTPGGPAI
ncbi:MAG: hypothetical protein K8T25_23170 [Planctomycetia bacterium]|nr:hypothetical protein [Planctomycetia bacterium]